MKILKTKFRKNDLFYTLIYRNDKVALYETRQEGDMTCCHYEVARIYIKPAHTAIGVEFEEAEVLTSNEKFFYDGSGAFIKKDNAIKHFNELSATLTNIQATRTNVQDKRTRMPKQPLMPGACE
jgi:hypothetical protein